MYVWIYLCVYVQANIVFLFQIYNNINVDDASDIIAEMLREENERARLAKEEAAEQAKLAAAAKEALSSKSSKKQVKKKSTKKSAPKSDL